MSKALCKAFVSRFGVLLVAGGLLLAIISSCGEDDGIAATAQLTSSSP